MKIGKTFNEYDFDNEAQKLYVNMLYLSSWLNTQVNEFMKEYNLTKQQFNVLRILMDYPERMTNVTEITSKMVDKSSNVTRLVEKLIANGYVVKAKNKENRRIHEISLTEKGLAVLETIREKIPVLYRFMEVFTIDEIKSLNEKLNTVREKY
jgi:DNA-binding MarR family transcriptional regulator